MKNEGGININTSHEVVSTVNLRHIFSEADHQALLEAKGVHNMPEAVA